MGSLKMVLAGLLGGILGATIWTAVAHFTGYEIGFVAWGVGVLVGLTIAATCPRSNPTYTGLVGACIAFVAIVGGKAGTAFLAMEDFDTDISQELLISYLADDLIGEYEMDGRPLEYPAGADLDYPESQDDYPTNIWAQAENQWFTMGQTQRDAMRSNVEAEMTVASGILFVILLIASFGLMDLLWLFLALGSAFKISSNAANAQRNPEGTSAFDDDEEVAAPQEASFLPNIAPPAAFDGHRSGLMKAAHDTQSGAAPAPSSGPKPLQPRPLQAPTEEDEQPQREAA